MYDSSWNFSPININCFKKSKEKMRIGEYPIDQSKLIEMKSRFEHDMPEVTEQSLHGNGNFENIGDQMTIH